MGSVSVFQSGDLLNVLQDFEGPRAGWRRGEAKQGSRDWLDCEPRSSEQAARGPWVIVTLMASSNRPNEKRPGAGAARLR